jgi:excinuclease ABC subunit B
LRSERSLIQTIGRAARHVNGQAILYADNMTDSMTRAIEETERRRGIQTAHNKLNNITPTTVQSKGKSNGILQFLDVSRRLNSQQIEAVIENIDELSLDQIPGVIKQLETEMKAAAKEMEFELAAKLRDRIRQLRENLTGSRSTEK